MQCERVGCLSETFPCDAAQVELHAIPEGVQFTGRRPKDQERIETVHPEYLTAFSSVSSPLPLLLQEVAAGECSRGGRLLEEPKVMLFRGNTFSLQVSIQDVPQLLWSIKPFTTCQVAASLSLCARARAPTRQQQLLRCHSLHFKFRPEIDFAAAASICSTSLAVIRSHQSRRTAARASSGRSPGPSHTHTHTQAVHSGY